MRKFIFKKISLSKKAEKELVRKYELDAKISEARTKKYESYLAVAKFYGSIVFGIVFLTYIISSIVGLPLAELIRQFMTDLVSFVPK